MTDAPLSTSQPRAPLAQQQQQQQQQQQHHHTAADGHCLPDEHARPVSQLPISQLLPAPERPISEHAPSRSRRASRPGHADGGFHISLGALNDGGHYDFDLLDDDDDPRLDRLYDLHRILAELRRVLRDLEDAAASAQAEQRACLAQTIRLFEVGGFDGGRVAPGPLLRELKADLQAREEQFRRQVRAGKRRDRGRSVDA